MSLMRAIAVAVGLPLCLVCVVGCGSGAPVATNQVSAVEYSFGPNAITVPAGTTVIWTNKGGTVHNVVDSTDGFGSASISPGATFTHTFAKAGTYSYICTFHVEDQMVGTVIVTP
jgi:plastocyanin